ncbi:hypothetical protein [uncultured Bradyrhizobium sp.]|uniref:hypothetical protein n=1 Tax=uncultured Bradyrhizobium sp. TaxID=199684 RepID=UPI0035CAB05A
MAYKNVRPAVALLVWLIVNVFSPTGEMYQAPAPNSAAALAVIGIKIGTDPGAHIPVGVLTTVVAAPVTNVTVPTALDRPAASCCIAILIFF